MLAPADVLALRPVADLVMQWAFQGVSPAARESSARGVLPVFSPRLASYSGVMSTEIRISPCDARDAKGAVEVLGADLESAAKFPSFPYVQAPLAENACDDIQPFWERMLSTEMDGVEALGLAFVLIAERFGQAEERFVAALDDLDKIAAAGGVQ